MTFIAMTLRCLNAGYHVAFSSYYCSVKVSIYYF